jgi:hypothetical protein
MSSMLFRLLTWAILTDSACLLSIIGYYIGDMKKRANKQVEASRRKAAGMASATRGRARRFTDRRKEQARRACRGKNETD